MTLYGIAVDGWIQVKPLHGVPVDNFCVDGRFHVGISCDAPTPGNGWHVSVAPLCSCDRQHPTGIINDTEAFNKAVDQVAALIGKPLHPLGPSWVGVYHWDEIRKL